MKAIVYTPNTGSTERYAKLLGRETGLSVLCFAAARDCAPLNPEQIDEATSAVPAETFSKSFRSFIHEVKHSPCLPLQEVVRLFFRNHSVL